ncbi:hypothetical protein NNO07_22520 [Pseudomonas resinovorans]|uniref:Uncharacterized protein n=1 Tax=Metapseudomonas resinovorans TaxID=53412 RepID=A0ABT4YAE8_METRE|nr:hypothetical protein [Pseudomonas resinovorans]MDA8485851.1 hypothetical protein [Pseudomonas resinovorans]
MAAVTISGGEKLEAKFKELAKKLGKGAGLKAGFLETATYPEGTPVATVAAANEFGDPEIERPPRPFFRNAIQEKSERWADGLGELIKSGNSAEQSLALTGEAIRNDIQESIRKFSDPPLAPSTIAQKGFEKPLIDSSVMINAVDYEVRAGESK